MKNKFSKNLKELRTIHKISQKQLAIKMETTDRTIRHWENENTEPSYDTLGKLAQVFNVSVGQLLGFEEY